MAVQGLSAVFERVQDGGVKLWQATKDMSYAHGDSAEDDVLINLSI